MTAEARPYSSTKEHKDSLRVPDVSLRVLRGYQTWFFQAIKYGVVGITNTLIDAAAYYALTRWLWLGSLPILAKGIAYAIGMTNSFYWNRNWTFKSQSNPWKAASTGWHK